MKKARKDLGVRLFAACLISFSAVAQAINVTVSIPPVAGIIAPLLGEEDKLTVIMQPGQSPHSFHLSPSHLSDIQKADLVIWVGTPVDNWMKKPLHRFETKALSMYDVARDAMLPMRQGGLWEKHSNAHAHHAHHHDHGSHQDEHQSIKRDGHLWMSLQAAIQLVKNASAVLQELKPNQAEQVQKREQAWLKKLQQTDQQVNEQLQEVQGVPFMVLHDAFQYFEKQYQLNGIGSIQLNPTVAPSLKRVYELREKIKQGEARCVFKEPQFPAKKVAAVTKGLDVKIGSLDPIGMVSKEEQTQNGRSFLLYDQFMQRLADHYLECLRAK